MINLRQNKAFALTFSLILIFMIAAFMAAYVMAVANGIYKATRADYSMKAYYIADAGLLDAYERIIQSGLTLIPTSTCANTKIPSTCTVPYISSTTIGTDNGQYKVGTVTGNYIVSVVYSPTPWANYTITSTGTYNNISKTLQLTIQGKAISEFAYWSNTEVNPSLGNLWWISGNLTNGPIQTNGQFNIKGNPVFNGPVTESNLPYNATTGVLGTTPTSSAPNYANGTGTNPSSKTVSDPSYVFPLGITSDAPPIVMPPPTTISDFNTAATSGGLVLTGASTIILKSDGTVNVTGKVVDSNCNTTTTYSNTSMSISTLTSKTIYVQSTKTIAKCNSSALDGNATVKGTLSGQLTIAADQNIYLPGSVQYNDEPVRPGFPGGDPNSTDLLGLVAYNNITVQEATAPANLEVDGVLVALSGSFNVDQYSKNPDPVSGGDGAVMTQFGSLVNDYSGCTGVVNSSGVLTSGWLQDQSYDSRLKTIAPPGFPAYVNNSNVAFYTKSSITECNTGACG
jgi:hypothetical protein